MWPWKTNKLCLAPDDNTLILWDLKTGKAIHTLKGHSRTVIHCVALDNQQALSCSSDGSLRLWDLRCGEKLACYHLKGQGYAVIRQGELLDYSENAWEHLEWVVEDGDGGRRHFHFDEIGM